MLCSVFPDWTSIDSLRRAHSVLEGGALIFFAALVFFDTVAHFSANKNPQRAHLLNKIGLICFAVAVVAEICAYPYGQRNDALISQHDKIQKREIAALENSTQQLRVDAASARKDAEAFRAQALRDEHAIAIANERTAEAEQRTAEAELKLADLRTPRSLTGKQFTNLVERLKPFARTPYALYVYNDEEAIRFLGIIRNALFQAGWVRKADPTNPPGAIPIPALDLRDGGPLIPYFVSEGIRVLWSPGQQTAATVFISELSKDGLSKGLIGMSMHSQFAASGGETPVQIGIGRKPVYEIY